MSDRPLRCSRCGETQDKESALKFLLIHEVTCYPESAQETLDAVNRVAESDHAPIYKRISPKEDTE